MKPAREHGEMNSVHADQGRNERMKELQRYIDVRCCPRSKRRLAVAYSLMQHVATKLCMCALSNSWKPFVTRSIGIAFTKKNSSPVRQFNVVHLTGQLTK